MLRIKIIRAVGPRVAYHKHSDALTEQEKRGLWLGTGCEAIGLAQGEPVTAEALTSLLKGYSPADGVYLGRRRNPDRRAAWDVCLSVHKSISVAGLCGPPEQRAAIRAAYDDAVVAFTPALEALACRSNAGKQPISTGNLIIATFTHERSRHDDPHLHTHYLVINATHDGDSWRGLEPVRFFRSNLDLDRAFQRELLRALRARNITAELDPNGRVRLPAISAATCDRLSTAHATIIDAMKSAPKHMVDLHPEALAALLNDRLRPMKKPLAKAIDFDRVLTAAEMKALLQLAPTPPAPPPQPPTQTAVTNALRNRLAGFPYSTLRNTFSAAMALAVESLFWPLSHCISAFTTVLASPRTRKPWRASPQRQRQAAATIHSPTPAMLAARQRHVIASANATRQAQARRQLAAKNLAATRARDLRALQQKRKLLNQQAVASLARRQQQQLQQKARSGR